MTCTLPFVRRMASDFDRAKELLVGAMDTVIQMANQMTADSTSPLGASGQSSSVSASSSGSEARRGPTSGGKGLEEHRRLFSFAPSKASRRCKGKTPRAKQPQCGPSTWRKDCVCLRSSSRVCLKIQLQTMSNSISSSEVKRHNTRRTNRWFFYKE